MYSETSWAEFVSKRIEACEICSDQAIKTDLKNRVDIRTGSLKELFVAFEISPLFWDALMKLLPSCKRCGTRLSLSSNLYVGHSYPVISEKSEESALTKYEPAFKDLLNQLESGDTQAGEANPTGQEIINSISSFPVVEVNGIQWFRGRCFDKGYIPPSHEFGAPPANAVKEAGRYNDPKESHLYVSNTYNGAGIEVTKHSDGKPVWIQQVEVPRIQRVLKFTIFDSIPSAEDLVLYLTISGILDNLVLPEYLFTRFIKHVMKKFGFDGILYSQDDFRYFNLVVFNPSIKGTPIGGNPQKYQM